MKAYRVIGTALLLVLAAVSAVCPMLTKGETAALTALAQHDKKYVFNTEGPDTFDCSGLVMYAYAPLGFDVEHWANGIASDDQYETFEKIGQARIGDMVFFDTTDNKVPVDHVGIWIGQNRFVHASSSAGCVTIGTWDDTWNERFVRGKRFVTPIDMKKPTQQTEESTKK